jgi:hypothetical protein
MSCRRTVTVKCGICGVPTRTSTAACTQHSARFGVNPARYQRSQGAAAHSARAGTLSKKALGSRSCCPCWCARLPLLPLGTYYHTAFFVCVRVVRRVSRKRMCTSDARGLSLRLRFAMQPVSPCETIVEVLGTGALVSLLLTWITCNALARNAPARGVS